MESQSPGLSFVLVSNASGLLGLPAEAMMKTSFRNGAGVVSLPR
jgi:hypothetical protein